MPFVVCYVWEMSREGSSTLIKDWFGCSPKDDSVTLANFYDDFANGKFDNEPVPDQERTAVRL